MPHRFKSAFMLRTGLFLIYFCYLAVMTLAPFDFSLSWLGMKEQEGFFRFLIQTKGYDLFNNVLLFIPLGLLYGKRLVHVLLCAAVVSLSIESAQLFLSRSSSLIDWSMNVLGSGLGFISRRWMHILVSVLKHKAVRIILLAGYGLSLAGILISPVAFNDLKKWDPEFLLSLGDEVTGERPWNGRIYALSIHGRHLTSSQVAGLYSRGLESGGLFDPVLSYRFQGFEDLSGLPGLLEYPLEGNAAFENGGVRFGKGHLTGIGPASELTRALQARPEFSVEVWAQTLDLEQTGPARIVTLSMDRDQRNFTLGQTGREIQFRVRTRLAGKNGSWICLNSGSVLQDTLIHHFTATFARGIERIYVDGRPSGRHLSLFHHVRHLLQLGRGKISWLSMAFALFVPLGFVSAFVWPKKTWFFGFLTTICWIALYHAVFFLLHQPLHPFTALCVLALPGVGLAALIHRAADQSKGMGK